MTFCPVSCIMFITFEMAHETETIMNQFYDASIHPNNLAAIAKQYAFEIGVTVGAQSIKWVNKHHSVHAHARAFSTIEGPITLSADFHARQQQVINIALHPVTLWETTTYGEKFMRDMHEMAQRYGINLMNDFDTGVKYGQQITYRQLTSH